MKTFTAAAGVLSLATMAAAIDPCAVDCFTKVITDHPPLDCKEANMYLCFCTIPSLQNYFIECAYSDCGSDSAAKEAVNFGVEVCDGYGKPITIPLEPASPSTSAAPASTKAAESSKAPAEPASSEVKGEEPTSSAADEDDEPKMTSSAMAEKTTSTEDEPEEEETTPAEGSAPAETSAATEKPTSVEGVPAGSDAAPSGTPTPSSVPFNAGNSLVASGFVAAGAAVAAFQLL